MNSPADALKLKAMDLLATEVERLREALKSIANADCCMPGFCDEPGECLAHAHAAEVLGLHRDIPS